MFYEEPADYTRFEKNAAITSVDFGSVKIKFLTKFVE
jgi:hypothetical protein